jgi:excisionase family DNA binding protein
MSLIATGRVVHEAQRIVSTFELADQLRVDKRTVYRLLRSGKLPLQIVHIGESPRVRRVDLEQYLERLALDAADADQSRRTVAWAWLRRRKGA